MNREPSEGARTEQTARASDDAKSWLRPDRLTLDTANVSFWCEEVAVDLRMRIAWCAHGPVELRPLETNLLTVLLRSSDQVVATTEILRELYPGVPPESARLRLRSVLAEMRRRLGGGLIRSLRTARGVGLILYVGRGDHGASADAAQ